MEQQSKQGPSLAGKKVIVLGASSGIGLATAQAAAHEGAQVTIVSGNRQRLDKALGELPEGCEAHVVDLADESSIKAFFAQAGNFDHMVYTAGETLQIGAIGDADMDKARQFFNVRYWGAFATVKYGAPHISKGGSIGLCSGISATRPGKGWGLGASICSAMEGFARAMSVELAPLRVNIVSPGLVRTNLWSNMTEADREGLYTTMGSGLPVGRVGEAEDIAQAYIYLMKQQYCTGQTLVVDGGAVRV